MEQIEYNGTYYLKRGKWWVAPGGLIDESIQGELNAIYVKTLDYSKLTVSDVIKLGDDFKLSNALGLAIRCYETAAEYADKQQLAYILPRVTSCYRKQGSPQKAIDMLAFASGKYGKELVTVALLTSAGAAYCDLGEYALAKKTCDRAYRLTNGNIDDSLRLVYKRIEKETR